MTIPSEALSVVDDQAVCFVLGPPGVERRVVDVRPGSTDRLQVVEGLAEGEEVVLGPYDPSRDPEGTRPGPAEEVETTWSSQPAGAGDQPRLGAVSWARFQIGS